MDTTRFTDKTTGRLIRITEPHEDFAFLPENLPPSWKMPTKLWPLLVDAHRALANLDGIGQTLPDPELLLRPLQQREALRSSSLEGTFATPEELLLFEMQPRDAKNDTDQVNEWREVFNYGVALRQGHQYLLEQPPSILLVRQLHHWLMEGVRGGRKAPGEIRNCQVFIGSNARFVPPPPIELSNCLDQLEHQLRTRDEQYDPLVNAYLVHYQFGTIHPFQDGNGRVGRVLLALLTSLWCHLSHPWLYMSAYFEKHRDEYVDSLFNISARGAWTQWVEFCLEGTVLQARDSIRRCRQLLRLREEYHAALGANSSGRLHQMVDSLFSAPLLTIPQVAKKFSVTYPTAKSDVETLIALGVLREMNEKRPRSFFSHEIFGVAYSDESG